MRAASDIRPADHPVGASLDAEVELLTAVVAQARRDGDADFLALVQTHLKQSGCPATATFQAISDRATAAAVQPRSRAEIAAEEQEEAWRDSLSRGVRENAIKRKQEEQREREAQRRREELREQEAQRKREARAKRQRRKPEKDLVCKTAGVRLTESDYQLFEQVCEANGRNKAVQMRLWLHEEAERLGLS